MKCCAAPARTVEQTLSAFLDTNILSATSPATPRSTAARATAVLADTERLLLTDVVFAECIYVLESFYEVKRDQVAALMRSAIALPTLETVDPVLLLRALEVYELDRLDFAEAYLVAQAEVTGIRVVLSFDRSIDRIDTVTGRQP